MEELLVFEVDLKVLFSIFALVLSFLSYLFTRNSWFESNRPIVCAEIETCSAGNEGIAFNIVVRNTGNRPASEVRLIATPKNIDSIIGDKCTVKVQKEINRVFSQAGEISILQHGESVSNGFGYTSSKETSPLNYGVKFPVKIKYKGINGKRYTTKQKLIVKDSEFFAGSGWSRVKVSSSSKCNT